MTFSASIQPGGKVSWQDPQGVKKFIESLEGKRVTVAIEQWRDRRSLDQNSYFHGPVCKILGDHLGYYPEEMKEIYREQFLRTEKNGRSFLRSTASLNTKEFSEFVSRCIEWAAQEFGVVIPDPE